ncbi:formyltetrahydrofolate deformylase [[Actinobacillus] muris]|uniref:Formyltetrahydrofolate deformylase n=1 Tax=Muribacter muris TaxID=67855 RepID=A0A0J5P670_9PAST|nr:formyltetrahydrofolate deformylase [Muribacter muris]KMK51250.1 formyltetrahydrofolate deformylase [[Actinobacillus] muris] [Muribacter muris]
MIEHKILLTECPDATGLVAKITNICYKHQLNIVKNSEFVDAETGRFFMRTELQGIFNDQTLLADLDLTLPQAANYRLVPKKRKRIVILVTKEAHCLAERFDVPFHLVSHEGLTRVEHDQQLAEKIDQYTPDYIVLAKYMRVLNPEFVARYPNRVVNIHHSFLPAFIGARPYQQAYERGVKIIGATAHFINNELDQGPIIMQNVINIDHTYTADAMMRAGRDVEKTVLSRALELVLADRVFVHQNKTIVM